MHRLRRSCPRRPSSTSAPFRRARAHAGLSPPRLASHRKKCGARDGAPGGAGRHMACVSSRHVSALHALPARERAVRGAHVPGAGVLGPGHQSWPAAARVLHRQRARATGGVDGRTGLGGRVVPLRLHPRGGGRRTPRPRRHPRVVARGGACRKPLPGDGRRVRRGFQLGVPRGGRGAGGLPQTGAPLRHRAARAPGRLTRASSPSPGEGTRPARRRRPAARHPPGAAPAEPAAPASTHVPGPRRAPGTTRPRAAPPRSGWR